MFLISEKDANKFIHEVIGIFTVIKVSEDLHNKKLKRAEQRLIDLRQSFLAALKPKESDGREKRD